MMQPRPSQATSVTFRGLCTGDLFVVVDISKKRTGTGYDELRICFYIFFGLASVVSSLSLISKRAVWPPLCPLFSTTVLCVCATDPWPALRRLKNAIGHYRSRTNPMLEANPESCQPPANALCIFNRAASVCT